jgi:hypothetical protein
MHKQTQHWLVVGLLAASPVVFAQQGPPPAAPARQAPPPEDLEPGVNTSVMPANTAPAPATPAAVSPPSTTRAARGTSAAASPAPATLPAAASNTSPPGDTPPAPKAGKTSAGSKPSTPSAPATAANSGAKGGKAEDHLQLDTTQITGNQELPKVLYIVPWKRSDLGDLLGKPANSLLDEVLQPVDRDVFKRENRYYDALKPDAAGAADKATGAAGQGSGDKR